MYLELIGLFLKCVTDLPRNCWNAERWMCFERYPPRLDMIRNEVISLVHAMLLWN